MDDIPNYVLVEPREGVVLNLSRESVPQEEIVCDMMRIPQLDQMKDFQKSLTMDCCHVIPIFFGIGAAFIIVDQITEWACSALKRCASRRQCTVSHYLSALQAQ